MSKTVFDHLTEQIDQVVKGRRYIIAEIGKLKESVDLLKEAVEKSSGGGSGGIVNTINDLKGFMQRTITTLGELKGTVTQLGGLVKNLAQSVQSMPRGGSMPSTTPLPQHSASSFNTPAPTFNQPTSMFNSPAPAPAPAPMQAAPAPAPMGAAPTAANVASAAASAFDRIGQAAEAQTPAKDIGAMIDALRTTLSKINPLNPVLFELSMEAGRLKSLGGNPLDAANIQGLKTKIEKWKAKSA